MESQTQQQTASGMANILMMVKAAWPQFTVNQGKVYAMLLQDIPEAVLYKAVIAVCKESKFLPTIAEIRERAEAIYKTAKGIESPDASKAWEAVGREISRTGRYGRPKFEDPLAAETVKRMGWTSICAAEEKAAAIQRAQFMKIYNDLASRKKEDRKTKALLADGMVQAALTGAGRKGDPTGALQGITGRDLPAGGAK
nr:MAG TPA: replication protein P [Caudoviricetes sp.]